MEKHKFKLLSRMSGGVALPIYAGGDPVDCEGKDGCPAIAIDPSGKFLRVIGAAVSDLEAKAFEAQTRTHRAENEGMFDIPLSLLEAAGFVRK
jgi:hypothetical protein